LGFGVWGLGFEGWGLGFGIWGLGFGVWGFGVRALGLGLIVQSFVDWLSGFKFRVQLIGFKVSINADTKR